MTHWALAFLFALPLFLQAQDISPAEFDATWEKSVQETNAKWPDATNLDSPLSIRATQIQKEYQASTDPEKQKVYHSPTSYFFFHDLAAKELADAKSLPDPKVASESAVDVETIRSKLKAAEARIAQQEEQIAKWRDIAKRATATAAEWKGEAQKLDAASQANYKAAEEYRALAARLASTKSVPVSVTNTAAGHWQTSTGTTVIQTAAGHYQTTDGRQVIETAPGHFTVIGE